LRLVELQAMDMVNVYISSPTLHRFSF